VVARGESRADARRRPASRTVAGGALAALLSVAGTAVLAGCSGSDGAGGGPGDGGGVPSGSASPLPPGRYQSLPEPCGSIRPATLRALLPASSDYLGTAALTYDTDRRVGCRWSGTAEGDTRELVIDFERDVSYNASVSDEERARQEFASRAEAAHIPDAAPDAGGSGSPAPASGSPSAGSSDTSPRRVGGVGDEAYLDDRLTDRDSRPLRDVTIVFRTANVLVTVDLSQRSAGRTAAPPSLPLQLGAFGLAQELARTITR